MLVVGDNPGGVERVDVTPISGRGHTKVRDSNLIQMGGGGTLIADGGVVRDSINQRVNSQFQMPDIKVYTVLKEFREQITKYDLKTQLTER
jgi:hypothetical protein